MHRVRSSHVNRSPKLEGPFLSLSMSGGPPRMAVPRPRPLLKSPLPLLDSPLPRPRGLVENYEPYVSERNLQTLSHNSYRKMLSGAHPR